MKNYYISNLLRGLYVTIIGFLEAFLCYMDIDIFRTVAVTIGYESVSMFFVGLGILGLIIISMITIGESLTSGGFICESKN